MRLPEREDYRGRGGGRLLGAFRDIFSNEHARVLLFVYGIEAFGVASLTVLAPYLIEYVMRAPQLTEAFIALYLVPQLALTPVWIWLSRRVGKKRLWLAAMLTGFALQLVGFVPNAEQGELARTTLLALSGLLPCGCYLLGWLVFTRFGLNEAEHAAVVRKLSARAGSGG